MKLNLLSAVFMFVICLSAQAQTGAIVYTIVGKVSTKINGKNIFLKQRDRISDTAYIQVQSKAMITLLTQQGKFIEIRKDGTHSLKDLQKGQMVKPVGIAVKFFHLIWDDLFKPSFSINYKAIGGAVGGARRSCDILMEPVNQCKSDEDTLYFSWKAMPGAYSYKFTLTDSEKNELLNIITKDTSLTLLKRGLLQDDSTSYYWNCTPDNDLMEDCASFNSFTLTSTEKKEKEINNLIANEPPQPDDFLYNLKISNILAANGWYKESVEYYNKAKNAFNQPK